MQDKPESFCGVFVKVVRNGKFPVQTTDKTDYKIDKLHCFSFNRVSELLINFGCLERKNAIDLYMRICIKVKSAPNDYHTTCLSYNFID